MGKNNRKKQGSFFQSLFQVSSFNIRDFRASSTDEEAFSLLFECQGKFPATFRQLKRQFSMAFDAAAAILTGIECKCMTLCLVFSILPNFYEIKTNFPQNYNV